MDQKKAEQRQEIIQQQQQQQWFAAAAAAAPSQLAQVPPNTMFVYQNQVYQPYTQPNLNLNMQAIPFQPPVGPPLMQIQIPQQTATAVQGPPAPSQQPTMVRGNFQGGTRTPVSVVQQAPPPPQLNGFVQFMQPVPGAGASPAQQQRSATAATPQNASGIPSQFTQATSGPPLFQQRHQQPRGPRPPRHGHHNGHISNGNRLPYNSHHQQRFPPPQQQQQQQQIQQHAPPQPLYFNPMFQGQSPLTHVSFTTFCVDISC